MYDYYKKIKDIIINTRFGFRENTYEEFIDALENISDSAREELIEKINSFSDDIREWNNKWQRLREYSFDTFFSEIKRDTVSKRMLQILDAIYSSDNMFLLCDNVNELEQFLRFFSCKDGKIRTCFTVLKKFEKDMQEMVDSLKGIFKNDEINYRDTLDYISEYYFERQRDIYEEEYGEDD